MFDIFYTGPKPNLFAHESPAASVEVAIKKSKTHSFWYLNGDNDYRDFDFNWVPDKWEAHQWHIFPDQWSRNSETYFINRQELDSEVRNYNSDQIVIRTDLSHRVSLKSPPTRWSVPEGVMPKSIDFSWHPDPLDPPYIYHFPTKYYKSSGLTYTVPGATQIKFVDPFKVEFLSSEKNWVVPADVERDSIDFTWRPDSLNQPLIYHFPTKFNKSSGVKYVVDNANKDFFVRPFYITHQPDQTNWVIPESLDETLINFTWRPDPFDPPYIYKFPSSWAADVGLEYHVPGATEFKFMSNKYGKFIYDIDKIFNAETLPRYYIETTVGDLIEEHQGEIFWALNSEMNYDDFDFSWHPDRSQRTYLHVFGSQWQADAQTFYVDTKSIPSKNVKQNFVKNQTVRSSSKAHIFYVDKFNIGTNEQYKKLSLKHNNITKIRYVDNMIDTIKRISNKTDGLRFWVISSENDYTNFDFNWHPEQHQHLMFHVFGTEHQKWSDTCLVNKDVFDDHAKWCKNLIDMPDLNFVEDQTVLAINVNDIYEMDFGQHNTLAQHKTTLKTVRFIDSYLSVIKRIVSQSASEHIWLTSNICDYSKFDFNWRPDYSQLQMLHVFGPGNNKFGDTFFIHVPTFKEQMDKLELLEEFKSVNYCTDQIVPRLPYDQVPYTGDDLTSTIKSHRFNSPYALFYPRNGPDISQIDYNPSMWRLKDRALHTFTESGSIVLAPRDILQYLDTQCYDYPEIKREKAQFLIEKPLDIVFISNGESTTDAMYAHLLAVTKDDSSLVVHWIKDVNGRAAAYKAAAEISDTDWAFNVFAKLEVNPDFDFHWQPDRLQEPKHYIFHALNPINGLEYGHQGMIAYNKKLVLETDEWGLDFTLSKEHEVISVLSGIAKYDTDPWIVWRTAFREVIKLLAIKPYDQITQDRIEAWFTGQEGEYGYMSIKGAADAHRYLIEVDYDHDKLLLTFEWTWLKEYYDAKY